MQCIIYIYIIVYCYMICFIHLYTSIIYINIYYAYDLIIHEPKIRPPGDSYHHKASFQ